MFLFIIIIAGSTIMEGDAADNTTILFKREGQVADTLSTAHMVTRLDTSDLIQFFTEIEKQVDNLEDIILSNHSTDRLSVSKSRRLKFRTTMIRETLGTERERLVGMTAGTSTEAGRQKRQILIGAAAIFGTIFGVFNTYQIHTLAGKVAQEGRRQDIIVHHIKEIDDEIEDNRNSINRTTRVLQEFIKRQTEEEEEEWRMTAIEQLTWQGARQANRVMAAVAQLQAKKLPMDLLTTAQLSNAWSNLTQRVEEAGYQLLIDHPQELFQLDTSFAADKDGFTIITHVPMAWEGDIMDVFRFVPIPFQVSEDTHAIFLPKKDVLFISKNGGKAAARTRADLAACPRKGDMFLCTDANMGSIINSDTPTTNPDYCALNLYKQDHEKIKRACPVHLINPVDSVEAISDSEFIFLSHMTHVGEMKCADGKTERIAVNRVQHVSIKPGCRMTTRTNFAVRPAEMDFEAAHISYSVNINPAEYLGNLDVKRYEDLLETLEEKPKRTSVEKANNWLNDLQETRIDNTHMWVTTAIGVVVALAAALAVAYYIKRKADLAYARGRETLGRVAYQACADAERQEATAGAPPPSYSTATRKPGAGETPIYSPNRGRK